MNRFMLLSLLLSLGALSAQAQHLPKKPIPNYSPFGLQPVSDADLKAFNVKREKQALANKAATTKIIQDCDNYTKKGDVEKRGILSEVRLGMGDTCKVESPAAGLESFMKDVKKIAKSTNQDKIWDETTKIALEKAVEGLLALHMRVAQKSGVITAAQAEALICAKTKLLCTPGRPEFAIIKKSVAQFMATNKAKPIEYLDGPKQSALKDDFNAKINLANQTCALTKKKYDEIKWAHSCTPLPDFSKIDMTPLKPGEKRPKLDIKPMKMITMQECDDRLYAALQKHKVLETKAREAIMFNMQLLVNSPLGPLFATKSFRKKVGTLNPDFVYESCMKGNGSVLNNVWHEGINEARSELYALANNELTTIQHKRMVPPQYIDKENELEKYLKTNPLTISELLKRSADPNYAKAICSYVKGIHRSDKISNYVEAGLTTIGVISAIAFGFATAGSGFAILTPAAGILAGLSVSTTGIIIAKNGFEYHGQLREDQANRQSIATHQRNLVQGIEALEVSDRKKDALISNMKWGAAGLVLEVAGLGFSLKKAITLIDDLKKTPALFEMVDGATNSIRATNLHKGSQAFTKGVKTLDPTKVGQLKNLSPDHQTKLAAMFSKLDEPAAKLLVDKLAKLTPEEFAKFFKVIDDANLAKVPSNLIVASINDFSKTGQVKKIKVPLTPEEIAKLGPKLPRDANKISTVYPNSSRALKEMAPELSPTEMKKFIASARSLFSGMVKDDDIALMIERYSLEGTKSPSDMLKRFQRLTATKQKHIDMFQPNGLMNSPAFKNESDLTKLAYLDELERNGIPMRNSKGDLILTAEETVMRKSISKLPLVARIEAIQKEMSLIARQNPCSL
ncbi:MAG: hypothetical protein H0V66_07090 [Bdellovibrionales bacterium]|nr:hypothetical protein [Bdellovibrionales bacterium]